MRKGLLHDRDGSNMAEAAIAMPVVLLVLMFAINAALASYTAVAAANAVNYGARMGAITRGGPEIWAKESAKKAWEHSHAGGSFSYSVLISDPLNKRPDGISQVTGRWSYPTLLSGLCTLFGGTCPSSFQGTVTATYRREGY